MLTNYSLTHCIFSMINTIKFMLLMLVVVIILHWCSCRETKKQFTSKCSRLPSDLHVFKAYLTGGQISLVINQIGSTYALSLKLYNCSNTDRMKSDLQSAKYTWASVVLKQWRIPKSLISLVHTWVSPHVEAPRLEKEMDNVIQDSAQNGYPHTQLEARSLECCLCFTQRTMKNLITIDKEKGITPWLVSVSLSFSSLMSFIQLHTC